MKLTCWISVEELAEKTRALRDEYINEVLRAEGFNLDRFVLSGFSRIKQAFWFAQERYQHEPEDAYVYRGGVDYLQGEDEL